MMSYVTVILLRHLHLQLDDIMTAANQGIEIFFTIF